MARKKAIAVETLPAPVPVEVPALAEVSFAPTPNGNGGAKVSGVTLDEYYSLRKIRGDHRPGRTAWAVQLFGIHPYDRKSLAEWDFLFERY
jgi:hypothetical protein